ncbi:MULTISPECIES: NAD(P)/FAD-dependent oxidoreductase [Mammaliicoccus]|uniref:NAD(P)/FAD-dependent oxidoreductase n=1 Tax=Mammaliicoccus sciuri TaxID=1296 RepID=A0ABT7HZT7_MAMSC|nr:MULTISPECIES: NAD(P)/FAD-dependent oxidoreductase [Mammaliicoccus]MCJ0914232.1 NAD(P)/FAD-dependent oxidoreductase [Mammaliicoccus sciuri]MCJ0941712.1 NAD(P)/FAD-dependent oxidoreductase [Mammaliicoccus sciuri]MDL0111682.1 NAD(P)/FAD-dependent oxidoreductase [Mammaliicoccus sciuri]MDL0117634.1 NAD(P)/FAD-dependent oxidoreductase [Mammaliicoccus sciuri]MDO0949014.1 NAD(P)/FAD-dependent oxidoreductase [Mammaliicoccus sciuri]
MYHTIIIGAGPSGLMAAYSASSNGKNVLLLEKKKGLGRKLRISGGGRCNVTNRLPYEEIIKNIPGNGKFLYSPFSTFDNESIIQFFESRSVQLKEEDHGRMFPVSNRAQDVVDALVDSIKQNGVEIRQETTVSSIESENQQITGVTLQDGTFIPAKTVIIASGGCSVPHTGSTGDGYKFAERLGHSITELFPTEVPIKSSEPFIKNKTLQGLSLQNVGLSVLKKNGKPRITHQMDMLFTHFGVSGPAALRCSQFVYKEQKSQKKTDIQMSIDAFPEIKAHDLEQQIVKKLKDEPNKAIKNALKGLVQERYLHFILQQSSIDLDVTYHHLSQQAIRTFVENLKSFTFTVNGTLPLDKAFVTGGGVNIKEIEPNTMASKICAGLYFSGEVLDIHGYTGGYNITSALVTGYVAGYNAAQFND